MALLSAVCVGGHTAPREAERTRTYKVCPVLVDGHSLTHAEHPYGVSRPPRAVTARKRAAGRHVGLADRGSLGRVARQTGAGTAVAVGAKQQRNVDRVHRAEVRVRPGMVDAEAMD